MCHPLLLLSQWFKQISVNIVFCTLALMQISCQTHFSSLSMRKSCCRIFDLVLSTHPNEHTLLNARTMYQVIRDFTF